MRFIQALALLGTAAALVEAANSHASHRRHHARAVSGKTRKTGKSSACRAPKRKPTRPDTKTGGSASNSTTAAGAASDAPASSNNNSTATNASAASSAPTSTKSGKAFQTASSSASSAASTSTGTSSGSSSTLGGVAVNGIALGFLPDEGDAGGSKQSMVQLNALMGQGNAATYGYYAQAKSGTPFDGGQLLAVMDDVKASGAIFEPAVMPTGGWQGLTADDDSQAVNICNVMKKFTDNGIETRLRFAHEVNFYQTDGTYQGNAEDFKAGWAAVASACKRISPSTQMFFTPNVANLDEYKRFIPDDTSTIDLAGIDFYPKSVGDTTFVDTMKPLHDLLTSNGKTKFAIGETGLGFAGSAQDRINWMKQITSPETKQALPNLVSVSWFNFFKDYDFRLLAPNDNQVNAAFLSFIAV